MPCQQLFDRHFCLMELLDPQKALPIRNAEAREIVLELSKLKMVEFDGDYARLLPDGVSALNDYRELCALTAKKLGL
jgi:hypothetical protein